MAKKSKRVILGKKEEESKRFPFSQRQINARTSDYVCQPCGVNFLTKAQMEDGVLRVSTFHDSECGLCKETTGVTHIRHWNYLRLPKWAQTFVINKRNTQ